MGLWGAVGEGAESTGPTAKQEKLPRRGERIFIFQQFAGKWDSPFPNSSLLIWQQSAPGRPSSPRDTDEWEIVERIQESVKTAFWGKKKKTHLACQHSAAARAQ